MFRINSKRYKNMYFAIVIASQTYKYLLKKTRGMHRTRTGTGRWRRIGTQWMRVPEEWLVRVSRHLPVHVWAWKRRALKGACAKPCVWIWPRCRPHLTMCNCYKDIAQCFMAVFRSFLIISQLLKSPALYYAGDFYKVLSSRRLQKTPIESQRSNGRR